MEIASLPLAISFFVGCPSASRISWHLFVVLHQCSIDLCFLCAPWELPVPLSQRCLSCTGAALGPWWAVVNFTALQLLILFIQTHVWATVQTSQAMTLWLFHISLHPALILCSPLVPHCNWFSDDASALLLSQSVCLCAQAYPAEDKCSPVLFLFWFFTACFSLCTLAGPFYLLHTPAKRFLIPWEKCQSAFVTDCFKPRYGILL